MEIMAQILAFCTQARRKTRIMYGNNLSHEQLKAYLMLLTSQGLLAHNSDKYETTLRGQRFLEAFAQLHDVLDSSSRGAFEEVLSESYAEVKIVRMEQNSMFKDAGISSRASRKLEKERARESLK